MNPEEAIKVSMLAGEIMLANGAETYRVEDTMRRFLSNFGYDEAEAFAISTSIIASVTSDGKTVTKVKRVGKRSFNIERIIQVNDISRSFAEGQLTPEQTQKKLEEIKSLPQNLPLAYVFASGVSCACFSYIFGGQISDCLNAFFTGFILQVLLTQLKKVRMTELLVNILGGAVISFLALTFLNLGIGKNLDFIIIGSLMPLLPGMTMTNAVRDILEGDYLSGSARVMDAFIVALAVASGVGTAINLWFYVFGGMMI